jgi:glycosyltransferase involved in cell wall biosynthesis
LFINYELPPVGAGAGNATANISRHLATAGHDVHVLTARFNGLPHEERRDGYTIHRVPAVRRRPDQCAPWEMLSFTLGGMWPAVTLGRRLKPDVLCPFFGMPSGPIALLVKRLLGIPYVVSLRGGDVPGFMQQERAGLHALALPVIKAVWRGATGLLANSEGLAALARETWPAARITVIPNGVDTERFVPQLDQGRQAESLRLLCVGRLAKQKRFDLALEGLARSGSAAVLRLVGDGPERQALQRQAAALGLADRVEFAGWAEREALPAHYTWANALVLPSFAEGMANVVLEAMASGLPVIASDVYGNRDLVVTGESGILVAPGDANAIARAIGRLARDKDLLSAMATGGRQRALTYSWQSVAERYERALLAAVRVGTSETGYRTSGWNTTGAEAQG